MVDDFIPFMMVVLHPARSQLSIPLSELNQVYLRNQAQRLLLEKSVLDEEDEMGVLHLMKLQIIITMQKRSSQKPQAVTKQNFSHIQLDDVSENHSKIEEAREVVPRVVEEELELNLEKYSIQIKEEIRYILMDLLKYPSSSIAQRHTASNRLGGFDLKQISNKQIGSAQYYTSHHPPQYCEDCGLTVQEVEIPMCASVWEFPKAGEAVFGLFEDAKLLAGQVFILGIIFTILALYVTILEPTETVTFETFPRKVSYAALMLYSSSNSFLGVLLGIQGILIIITTLVWWALQLISQCLRQKYQRIVQQEDLSAADFTIMLEDVPAHYTREKMQAEFNRYFESLVYHHNLQKTWGEDLRPFEIQCLSQVLPFGLSQGEVMDQELEGLDYDILEKRQLLAEWMLQFKENSRFTFQKVDRKREYDNFERMQQRRKDKLHQMEERAREQYRQTLPKDLQTIFFVTFKHNQTVKIIQHLNPQSLPAKIRYILSCCRSAQYFSLRDELTNQEINITATRAPDPQDIIWGNLKAPLKKRVLFKLLTWAVIVAFWGATFGVCYGFNYLSIQAGLTFMPLVLAVIVTLSNVLLKFAIRQLSRFERDETETDRQRSILIKCLIALPINWIFTPIVITLIVNLNLYYSTGMVYFIFFLAITNAIIPPLLRYFDPWHLFRKLRALWKNRPYKKMQLRQSELNQYLQNEQYEAGWSYVYYIQLFYFTCLYAPMLPAVTISTLFGYFFMFWAEKYALLHRSRRPMPSMRALTETARTAMLLGPLIIGIGGFIWVCVFSLDFTSIKFIAYMVQMGLGVLYFLTPFNAIFKCLCTTPDEEILSYSECRARLPTDYERINPATSQKGVANYMAFLHRKREEDRATALNRSEDNLIQQLDINLMIDGMTKIPNIFGKNTDITRKLDNEPLTLHKSRVKKQAEELIFITPPLEDLDQKGKADEIESVHAKDEKMSRAETEKKPVVVNYSSSGNAYSRKKPQNERRTISVLQGNYDAIFETQSQKH